MSSFSEELLPDSVDGTRSSPNGLRILWQRRELLWCLVARDLIVKYQRSPLGFLWTLLNPLLIAMILVMVFSYVLRIEIERYFAFILSGYFAWNLVHQSLNAAVHILPTHANLRRSVAFPSEILIVSAATARLIEFFLEMVIILVVVAVLHHGGLPASMLLFPVIVVIQFALTVGLMFPIAVGSVYFRDLQHALPILTMGLFYLSPVFYPASMIPEAGRPYYFLNPFAGILTMYQATIYHGQMPSWRLLVASAAAAVVSCVAGHSVFRRFRSGCVELA